MYTYVCQILALPPTFLFGRALFGKTPSTRTHEARPDTSVEVSAPSVRTPERVAGARNTFYNRMVAKNSAETDLLRVS